MAVKHAENDDDIIFILKFSCLYSKIKYAILEIAYLVKEANKINSWHTFRKQFGEKILTWKQLRQSKKKSSVVFLLFKDLCLLIQGKVGD